MIIRSFRHLEGILNISVAEMELIASQLEDMHYHFSKVKDDKNGKKKFRHFFPSKKGLKHIQKKIQSRIFSKIVLPPHLQGCVKRRGNMTNCKQHKGKLYKYHTDIKKYFDYVSNAKVYEALVDLGFSPDVARLLTRLTTYQGHLAQGPPTSPFLANIAGLRMDNDILAFCREYKIAYTRFVDDLCFSSQTDFEQYKAFIASIVEHHGFFIRQRKTVYKAGRIDITGCNIGINTLRPTGKQIQKYLHPSTPEKTKKGLKNYFVGLKNV